MTWQPGPKDKALLDEMRGYSIMEPRPFVIDLERSEGSYLVTTDGQRLFDWASYYGSKLIGHNHPRLYEPEYLKRLSRAANNKVSNPDFVTTELVEYYRLLRRLTPRCMEGPDVEVFTVNSGAEACEQALKYMVKLYHERASAAGTSVPRYSPTPGFIYFEKGFHGRSVYTLNVTDMPHNTTATKHFHGLTSPNVMVPYPAEYTHQEVGRCLKAVEDALRLNGFRIAGIIVEPMQGAGGHRTAPDIFFKGLSELAHYYGVSLCFDEVQTAGGACGTTFLIDQYDLQHPPDVVVAAKKFACGVVWMRKPLTEKGILDSTWSGTLADMVRFVQEWKIVEDEGLIRAAIAKGDSLAQGLEGIGERFPHLMKVVPGVGLYQGFTLLPPVRLQEFLSRALDRNLLLFGAGTDSIRMRPNLSVTHAEVNDLLALLDDIFSSY